MGFSDAKGYIGLYRVYRDNGKENGEYLGLWYLKRAIWDYTVHIGIMEKKTESATYVNK